MNQKWSFLHHPRYRKSVPLVEKFQKCCQVRFGLVKRCWGTWSSPRLPGHESLGLIYSLGANRHTYFTKLVKTPWKNEGQQKWFASKLPIFRGDIGGVLFFQGHPFRQSKGRLGPLSLYHGRLPLPGFGSIDRFAIQKKHYMEPETKWTFRREIPISTSFLVGFYMFQFQEC